MEADRFDKVNDDFVARSYREYLGLDSIICDRVLLSHMNPPLIHDEFLFVDIHRNIEVWFFQMLVELRQARRLIQKDRLDEACEELERVARIFSVLTQTWDILATLRPREFWKFRDYFGKASGFQSAQFREVEFVLGHRFSAGRDLGVHRELKARTTARKLIAELRRPSLWDEVNFALKRARFPLDEVVTARDWWKAYDFTTILELEVEGKRRQRKRPGNTSVVSAWFEIYSDRDKIRSDRDEIDSDRDDKSASFYRLAERLLDISAAFAFWRFKHIVTVERFIGGLPGSGRSSGVPYLLRTLKHKVFPELWTVRDRFREWSKNY